MKKNKAIIPVVALAILLGAGAYGVNNIYAADDEQRSSLVDKLVEKFNLNKEDVEAVFKENREERKQEMEDRYNSMLDEAIENGEITEDQKNLILEKRAELEKEREANREKMKDNNGEKPSDEEMEAMKEERDAERKALESWAEEKGIDVKYLMGMDGHGGKGGFGGPMDKAPEDSSDSN